jgi:hypothetical protein
MKKISKQKAIIWLVLFFCILFLGISSVSASDALLPALTSTPTRTNRTPPPTPTGGGVLFPNGGSFGDFSCPVGTPIGLDTTVPDAMWLAVCGQCLPTATFWPTAVFSSKTPWPTGTVNPVNTAIATSQFDLSTPTPYGSPAPTIQPTTTDIPWNPHATVTPQVGYGIYCTDNILGEPRATCTEMSASTIVYTVNGHTKNLGAAIGQVIPGAGSPKPRIYVRYDFTNATPHALYGVHWNDRWAFDSSVAPTFHAYGNPLPVYEFMPFGYVVHDVNYYVNYIDPSTTGVYFTWDTIDTGFGTQSGQALEDTWLASGTTITFSLFPISETPEIATPTPIVTPAYNLGAVCSVVNNGTGNLTNQTVVPWHSSGITECFEIPSISTEGLFDFGSLGWFSILPQTIQNVINSFTGIFEVVTPAMTVCFEAYEMANVNLFGVILNYTYFFDVLIAFFIINHLMSK